MNVLHSLKEIAKDMSIYGVSTLIGQIISFFLLPLYTSYLSPKDYGILSLVAVFTGGYSVLSNFGISSAIFRFSGLADTEDQKNQYLDTAQFINIGLNLVFVCVGVLSSSLIAQLLFADTKYQDYVLFSIFLGFLMSISSVPLSFLRIQRKTVKVAYSSIINVFFTIICTVIGLTLLDLGIWGALVGNACGNVVSLIYLGLNVNIPKWMNFSIPKVNDLFVYALPMLPHKVFGFLLPVFSQVVLVRYLTLDDLGLYNIAFKFCTPLFVFIKLFQKAYSPYRFEILKEEKDNKTLFVNINLIYFLLVSIGFVFTVFLGDDLIRWLANIKFHEAGQYLLFVALIPIAQGLYFIFGTGIEFSKSPKFLPIISGSGFLVTLIGCFTLIPYLGINGAAISPTLGWLTMAFLVYQYAQRLYKLPYTWDKYIAILLITVIIVGLNQLNYTQSVFIDFFLSLAYLFSILMLFKDLFRSITNKLMIKVNGKQK